MTRVLAVDVGGTHVKWGVVVEDALRERGRLDTPPGGAGPLRDVLCAIIDATPADAVALGLAGWVQDGVVRDMSALGIADWDVAAALAPRPVAVVANDLTAACVGEAADAGLTLAVLAFGTGVAAGALIHERPWTGAGGLAGEVGHQIYRRRGRRCGCGRRGCVEAYAGWGGLRRAGVAQTPAELAARGDRAAVRLLDEALDAAGFAASLVVSALDPGYLRVGGGLAAAWGDRLRAAVWQGVTERCWHGERTRVAAARPDAALLGLGRLAAP